MRMSDPSKDPGLMLQLWESLPEPVKAAILGTILSIVMAFKNDQRTIREKITDVCAMAVIVFLGGMAIELLGLSAGWTYVLSGALGGFGIGPVKAFLKSWAERKTQQ